MNEQATGLTNRFKNPRKEVPMRRRLTITLTAIAFMAAFAAPASAHLPGCDTEAGRAWVNAAVRAVQQARNWGSLGPFTRCNRVSGLAEYDVYYSNGWVYVDLRVAHGYVAGWVAWNSHYFDGLVR